MRWSKRRAAPARRDRSASGPCNSGPEARPQARSRGAREARSRAPTPRPQASSRRVSFELPEIKDVERLGLGVQRGAESTACIFRLKELKRLLVRLLSHGSECGG